MYKVFIDKHLIVFKENNFIYKCVETNDIISLSADSNFEKWHQKTHEKPTTFVLSTFKPREAMEAFFKNHHKIDAAGGLVFNPNGELLMIKRNGTWDLPKGKVEQNEEIESAAIREVEEECGINKPKIIRKLQTTYHTYSLNGQHIFKSSHWYVMKYSNNEVLIPQKEEGIEEVCWIPQEMVSKFASRSYGTIKDLITNYYKTI